MGLKELTIVGGGLAGLSLGLTLRRSRVPVVVFEAGGYPRHRVCGEFISGRGLQLLNHLDLGTKLHDSGAVWATSARFFVGSRASRLLTLPSPALCLSRYKLDHLLVNEFVCAGGQLREHTRWSHEKPLSEEGIITATGRRPAPVENGWRWFGVKAHATHVTLSADLEVHYSPTGYVGICRLEGGKVNVCGLFRRKTHAAIPAHSRLEFFRAAPGTALRERLRTACFDESSFCSIGGLSLRPRLPFRDSECRIGDAVTMIPPVTGNGMSMALEAAGLATQPLQKFSAGELDWATARNEVSVRCETAFAQRLWWARQVHHLLLMPEWAGSLLLSCLGIQRLWQFLFQNTR